MKLVKDICLWIKFFFIFVWEDFNYRMSSEEERDRLDKKRKGE